MEFNTIAVDLAKNVFQLIGFDNQGKKLFSKRLNRQDFREFMHNQPSSTVVMEACYSSNYWARTIEKMEHSPKLIPAQHVTPFVRGNKNDKNDALAIYEASKRPNMNFVPIKTEAQQEILLLHKMRERVIVQRTSCTNQMRGLLVDFGYFIQQGHEPFKQTMWDIIHDDSASTILKIAANQAYDEFEALTKKLKGIDALIKGYTESNSAAQIMLTIPGVGPIIASAFSASIDKGQAFKSAKDFAVWLGLTPLQHASGNKSRLGGITKRGNNYLRKQLIHGARTVVSHAHKKDDDLNRWITKLKERAGTNKTVVATAHRLARLMWFLLNSNQQYKAQFTVNVDA